MRGASPFSIIFSNTHFAFFVLVVCSFALINKQMFTQNKSVSLMFNVPEMSEKCVNEGLHYGTKIPLRKHLIVVCCFSFFLSLSIAKQPPIADKRKINIEEINITLSISPFCLSKAVKL